MITKWPTKLIAFLMLLMLQSINVFSQDTTFTPPKGFIDSMSSREVANGHIIYLKKYYSQCMIGDSLNVNCPKIKQVTKLDLPLENRMVDLSWIKYFDNLTELTVSYNFIKILPDTFPSKLKKLNLFYNQIETSDLKPFSILPKGLTHLNVSYQRTRKFTKLPVLSDSLISLDASYNQITALPSIFPIKLKELFVQSNLVTVIPAGLSSCPLIIFNASYNQLTSLPVLGNKLERLLVSSNKITTLNFATFPSTLKQIDVSGNKLITLPVLNSTLERLDVSDNKLTSLPTLPTSIEVLIANKNQLTGLPALPNSLIELNVEDNAITSISSLPASLFSLSVGKNLLSSLPTLPSALKYVYAEHNSLTALPALSTSLLALNISKNNIAGILSGLPASLEELMCDTNAITSIVLPLPSKLSVLTFSNNSVAVFPLTTLPNTLYKLYCANNGLVSIPQLPEGLNEIRAKGNLFTCLPNLPLNLGITDIRIICNKNCWLPISGSWSVASNWSSGQVPNSSTDVIVLDGYVQINQLANVRNLDVRSSDFSGTSVLNVKGNINNVNTFFNSEINMVGTVSQTITTARNEKLTISNAAGVKIDYTAYIGQLSVPLGFVENTHNQNIPIQRLGLCHSGVIVQNSFIEVNTYLNSGWEFLSNNLINQKIETLSTSIDIGFGGSNQTVYKYNGLLTANNGWLPVAAATDDFVPGIGHRVYVYQRSKLTFAGVPFTGSKSFDVTYNTTGYDGGGWNLIGNPYMSPIDWDSPNWTKNNIDNAIYIWNADLGKYASYVAGAGTFGGSKNIAIGQAFFIKAKSANPNLQITENAKTSDYAPLLRMADAPALKITLTDAKSSKDEILLRVVEESTDAFDSNYDAYKLIGEGHNVSILGMDQVPLSISSIPLSTGTFPLEIEAEKTGKYTFSFSGLEKFTGVDVYLIDSYLDKTSLLESTTTYAFTLDKTIDHSRFKIMLSNTVTGYKDALVEGTLNVYPNPTKENATVVFPTKTTGQIVLTNIAGDIVFSDNLSNAESITLPLENCKGMYVLKVYTGESIFVTKIVKL